MSNYLKITVAGGDDYTIGLIGSVSRDGYSGVGEAWFNLPDVIEFASKLKIFAKTSENPPSLSGGNFDSEGNLSNVLFSLKFYSFSSYRAGVQIELANIPSTDSRYEETSRVTVELQPKTEEILSFCKQLESLFSNQIQEASLVG